MNKIPIIISVVALVAVTILFIDRISGKDEQSNTNTHTDGSTSIAYVKLDTLLDAYIYYNDKKTEFLQNQQEKERSLNSRYKAFERKVYELQKKVEKRMMTPTTAQKKQESLTLEQQKIMQDKQMYEVEIMEDNQKIMMEMLDSIKNYVKIYNQNHNYSIVLANDTVGSTIILADKKMDITNDIIKGLNSRYK